MPMRREQIAAALKQMGQMAQRQREIGQHLSPDQQEIVRIEGEIKKDPWYAQYVNKFGEEPDLSRNANYDYITAWKSGIRPKMNPHDGLYHWDSKTREGEMLKKPDHPTIWKTYWMDKTGIDPDSLGLKNQQEAEEWLRMRGRK